MCRSCLKDSDFVATFLLLFLLCIRSYGMDDSLALITGWTILPGSPVPEAQSREILPEPLVVAGPSGVEKPKVADNGAVEGVVVEVGGHNLEADAEHDRPTAHELTMAQAEPIADGQVIDYHLYDRRAMKESLKDLCAAVVLTVVVGGGGVYGIIEYNKLRDWRRGKNCRKVDTGRGSRTVC